MDCRFLFSCLSFLNDRIMPVGLQTCGRKSRKESGDESPHSKAGKSRAELFLTRLELTGSWRRDASGPVGGATGLRQAGRSANGREQSVRRGPQRGCQVCPLDTADLVVAIGPGNLAESGELGARVPSPCKILGPVRLPTTPAGQFGRTIIVCHERLADPNLNGEPRMTPRWDVDLLCPGWPLIHGPPADGVGS